MSTTSWVQHTGGCHCGRVRFEVRTPPRPTVFRCDCSICRKMGFIHLIVPKAAFVLKSGAEVLTSYRFGTRVAEHLFCSICGIQSFYVPRSNPDGYSVHVGCLDDQVDFQEEAFSGSQNWSQSAARIAHLSRSTSEQETP